jgi:hypothetical protein
MNSPSSVIVDVRWSKTVNAFGESGERNMKKLPAIGRFSPGPHSVSASVRRNASRRRKLSGVSRSASLQIDSAARYG